MSHIKYSFVIMCLFLNLFSGYAQDNSEEKDGPIAAVKEVFMKGSIDGKSVFLVYGFGDMSENLAWNAKDTSDYVAERAIRMKELVYNQGNDDYKDQIRTGAREAKEFIKEIPNELKDIIESPWRSLERMKDSHRFSMDNAARSRGEAKNAVTGALKWTGHATWAMIKNAYFLVVEIPVVTTYEVIDVIDNPIWAAAAVPAAIVYQTVRIALNATGAGIRTAWFAGTNAIGSAYSLASATTGAALTLAATGAVTVFHGGKWLVSSLPKHIARPVKTKVITDSNIDQQKSHAEALANKLASSEFKGFAFKLTSNIKNYSGKLKLQTELKKQKLKNAIVVSTSVVQGRVVVNAEITRAFLRELKKLPEYEGLSNKEIKSNLSLELQELITL